MPKKRQQRRPEVTLPKRLSWGPSANPALTEAILTVVDQQMRDDTRLRGTTVAGSRKRPAVVVLLLRGSCVTRKTLALF